MKTCDIYPKLGKKCPWGKVANCTRCRRAVCRRHKRTIKQLLEEVPGVKKYLPVKGQDDLICLECYLDYMQKALKPFGLPGTY